MMNPNTQKSECDYMPTFEEANDYPLDDLLRSMLGEPDARDADGMLIYSVGRL